MSQVEPGGKTVKTRATLTKEEDIKRQADLTDRMNADRVKAAKETAESHKKYTN
jgi:hypothetical protein